ncbi:MAG TPA: hypothetical protein VK115_07240 [Staphylococcus sp.]|nr:hypothetical protein [Staphylococcus sp.]
MKKCNIKASLFIDAILSFSIITTICILFLPMLLQLNQATKDKITHIEMKRILLISMQKYQKSELEKGFSINGYSLKLNNNKICLSKKDTRNEICYFKKD